MLLEPGNFLLLDEPTNHLDMRAKDVLLKSLMDYNGTVVFVSHDRYFIDKLATRIFEVGDCRVEIYPGNYEDYLWRKQGGAATLQETIAKAAKGQSPANGNNRGAASTVDPDSAAKRLNPIKRKHLEDRVREIEQEIAGLETAIAECESALQNFVSNDETTRLTHELSSHKKNLQARLTEWEAIGQTLQP
jgi:ATP-binding cassette subfamily F protein 3